MKGKAADCLGHPRGRKRASARSSPVSIRTRIGARFAAEQQLHRAMASILSICEAEWKEAVRKDKVTASDAALLIAARE